MNGNEEGPRHTADDWNRAGAAAMVVMGVRFLLEVASLTALGFLGFSNGAQPFLKWGLALLLPLAAATIWGRFVAPKARRRLADPARLVLEFLIFGAATAALAVSAAAWLAIAFGAVALVDTVLVRVLGLN